jgi:hypothetical protein
VLALRALKNAVREFVFWESPHLGQRINIMTDKKAAKFLETFFETQDIEFKKVIDDVEQ